MQCTTLAGKIEIYILHPDILNDLKGILIIKECLTNINENGKKLLSQAIIATL